MNRLPLTRLVTGPPPGPDRIFFSNLWFGGHNNPRYAELLPRLPRLDAYVFPVPEARLARAGVYRLHRATRHARHVAVHALASRRYRAMFANDLDQIRHFRGPVVVDVDDPFFTRREVDVLGSANVACYVVTADKAARRLEQLGLAKPWHVIPQGVSLAGVSEEEVARAAALRRGDETVVGYMAAWLLSAGDPGGDNPLYNVDHLLDLWDEVHARTPEARLWLIGGASERVRARVGSRDDVVLFGRLPRPEMLAHVANFDVGVYARTADQGVRAAKVAEYMGFGVPVVSYDYEVTEQLRETGAGLLVSSPAEFVDALVRLVRRPEERAPLAEAARRAGRELDWDVLARRYEELLDRYLPPR